MNRDRRDFLRGGLVLAIGALGTLGLTERAAGMTFRFVAGLRGSREISYPIPASDGVTIDRDNEVILVRWQESVYAFALSCPHQNTALRWKDDSGQFQCPKHKSKYSPDGHYQSGRATRGMDRYAVTRNGDSLVVSLEGPIRETDDAAAWNAATVSLR